MLLLIFLYPLRKRWKWLARKGKTKHWLDYHILMGLTAPAIVTFHAAFKFHGIAGLAWWSMIAVVVSGIVGRYFYGRIPRRLGEAEMSLGEAEKLRSALAEQVAGQNVLTRTELEPLLALPRDGRGAANAARKGAGGDDRSGRAQGLPDLAASAPRARARGQPRRVEPGAGGSSETGGPFQGRALSVESEALVSLWHVVHRPFSYSLAVLAILHIFVVTFLGFF
jgi:hypothetical protein